MVFVIISYLKQVSYYKADFRTGLRNDSTIRLDSHIEKDVRDWFKRLCKALADYKITTGTC